MTKKDKAIKKEYDALTIKEVEDLILKTVLKHFYKWYNGQTGIIIAGKNCIFKSDVDRYLEGILNKVPTYFD